MRNEDAVAKFYSNFIPPKESDSLEEDYIEEDEIKDFLPQEEYIHPSKDFSDHDSIEISVYPEDE